MYRLGLQSCHMHLYCDVPKEKLKPACNGDVSTAWVTHMAGSHEGAQCAVSMRQAELLCDKLASGARVSAAGWLVHTHDTESYNLLPAPLRTR